jgi:hypothetical protein
MNLQALTYYCEQCGDYSLGDSCFLHPRRTEEEERNAAREELKAHVVKELFRSETTKARQEGRRESFNSALPTNLEKDVHEFARNEAKSEVIKKIREWQNNQRRWTDSMPALFGNQLTGYQSALSDLIDFVNELEK